MWDEPPTRRKFHDEHMNDKSWDVEVPHSQTHRFFGIENQLGTLPVPHLSPWEVLLGSHIGIQPFLYPA